jgi:hypothetical protein
MCASPTDAKCDAPGANDDASGTAAVVEMARVMSKRKFDATIVFMTVPGEEQGLLGAAYFAEQAKINKTNIEAMFTNDIIGGVTTFKKSPERNSVRVFSEGVPSDETGLIGSNEVIVKSGIASIDLNGDKKAEYFRACTSMEGVHLTVWSGKPLTGKRIWHNYYYLGYDTEPTCKKKDYEGIDE